LVDTRHVRSQRLDKQYEDKQIQPDLKPIENAHLNHSGFRSARMRYTSKQREITPETTYRIFISRPHQALADEYQPKGYQEE
jgi:hypothetical protein